MIPILYGPCNNIENPPPTQAAHHDENEFESFDNESNCSAIGSWTLYRLGGDPNAVGMDFAALGMDLNAARMDLRALGLYLSALGIDLRGLVVNALLKLLV